MIKPVRNADVTYFKKKYFSHLVDTVYQTFSLY